VLPRMTRIHQAGHFYCRCHLGLRGASESGSEKESGESTLKNKESPL
jgi:hypothetical protein